MPANPFELLERALFASPLAQTVTYIPKGGSPISLVALVEARDEEETFGDASVQQDVLDFAIRRSDLPGDPRKGDRIDLAGTGYRVSGIPIHDALGKVVTVSAARTGT